jgi:hypothetical protein
VPPVKLQNSVTTIAADGKYEHRIRQSWLNTLLDVCPEQARLDMTGQLERRETDPTAVGTCVHAAIEDTIEIILDDDMGFRLEPPEVVDLFDAHWEKFQNENTIHWVKRNPDKATQFGRNCANVWATDVLPNLEPVATEVHFSDCLVLEDEHRRIYVSGTMDYVDRNYLGDWKTAGREYKAWEKVRWAIQPTVYWYAMCKADDLKDVRERLTDYAITVGLWKFIVTAEGKQNAQIVQLTRPTGWDGWLKRQLLSVVPLLEADLEMWPLRDQHALCGPKWCTAFASCKGAFVGQHEWAQPVEYPITFPAAPTLELV